MAHIIKTYEFPVIRRMKYPWNDWLDGRIWELERGEDFKIGTDQMRKNVYNAAWSRGIRVRTSLSKGNLIIQAFRAKDEKDPGKAA